MSLFEIRLKLLCFLLSDVDGTDLGSRLLDCDGSGADVLACDAASK